jgi:glycosyltransferase involved in cell wall biosynthesis
VGRLTRDKGLPELIESFEAIARARLDVQLLLVGWFDAAEDALDADLRTRIKNHPRIHCTGFVHDAAPFYRAMDLMVLPTWREGFPNAVLEAQATGIPVVTTISTGSRDSVVPEVTGLLIPPGYPQAITEAVLKLLRSPERRRQMGHAAREWVRHHYSDRHVLGLTVAFYREQMNARKNAGQAADVLDEAMVVSSGCRSSEASLLRS